MMVNWLTTPGVGDDIGRAPVGVVGVPATSPGTICVCVSPCSSEQTHTHSHNASRSNAPYLPYLDLHHSVARAPVHFRPLDTHAARHGAISLTL